MNPEKKMMKVDCHHIMSFEIFSFSLFPLARADVSRLYIGMDVLFFTSGSFIVYFLILHLPVQKYSIIEILEREENNLSLSLSLSLWFSLIVTFCVGTGIELRTIGNDIFA